MKQQLHKQKNNNTGYKFTLLNTQKEVTCVVRLRSSSTPRNASQMLQQALLSSAAFTEMCFHIPLVTCLAIVTEYRTCTCAQLDTRDRAIIGNAEFQ